MLVRIWKVAISPGKGAKLEAFAREVSLPMFESQPGCLGVLFSRTDRHCATVTLWDSETSVKAMEAADDYQTAVRRIEESGILGDEHHTEVFNIYGGFVSAELRGLLGQGMHGDC